MTTILGESSASTSPAHMRGDRLHPKRSERTYWVLSQLREAYKDAIREHLHDDADKTLVDFGCGNMPYRPFFQNSIKTYVGCDFKGNEMADAIISSDDRLPFAESQVDVVLSSQVLEHVEDPSTYLKEAFRVLKPGGLVFLSTHGTWPYHPDPLDLWRWTGDGLRRLVTSVNFDVVYFRGVVCAEAAAIQLWQDAVGPRLSRYSRRMFYWFMQSRMRRADQRCDQAKRDRDAAVYLLVAKKPEA